MEKEEVNERIIEIEKRMRLLNQRVIDIEDNFERWFSGKEKK